MSTAGIEYLVGRPAIAASFCWDSRGTFRDSEGHAEIGGAGFGTLAIERTSEAIYGAQEAEACPSHAPSMHTSSRYLGPKALSITAPLRGTLRRFPTGTSTGASYREGGVLKFNDPTAPT